MAFGNNGIVALENIGIIGSATRGSVVELAERMRVSPKITTGLELDAEYMEVLEHYHQKSKAEEDGIKQAVEAITNMCNLSIDLINACSSEKPPKEPVILFKRPKFTRHHSKLNAPRKNSIAHGIK